MPKISVLMSVYNTQEEYLREAIESILNQTYTDFEFIIINDGSSNNAKEVIMSYNDSRIKYFEQENKGLIYTLNQGLKFCNGEYIARMDSDDISLPNRFEKQVEILDSNSEIGVVGALIQIFPNKEKIAPYVEYPKFLDLIKTNQLAHPVVMIRKSILEKFNLKYENFLYAEDYELWSRFIKYSKIYNIQEVLLKYRIHPSSVSSKFNKQQIETDKKIKHIMLDFLTDDKNLQQKLKDLLFPKPLLYKLICALLQWIFSIKNYYSNGTKFKIITILGIKIKIKKAKTDMPVERE